MLVEPHSRIRRDEPGSHSWRVIFREGEPPLIALFGLMRAEDLPDWFRGRTWVEPELIIRTRTGAIHPEYSAVKLAIGFPP
jgi:hypothetical protein